jgi:hypothetical protein
MSAAAQLAIHGRDAEVDAVLDALTHGRPLEVLWAHPRRRLDGTTWVVCLDVRVGEREGRRAA